MGADGETKSGKQAHGRYQDSPDRPSRADRGSHPGGSLLRGFHMCTSTLVAVPKSKVRKKPESTVRAQALAPTTRALAPSPAWWPIAMATILLLGLPYLVV